MPFKMVSLGEKDVGRIAGYAGVHADLMTQKLTERWRESLPEGQEHIDVHQLQLCVRDDLHKLRTEIREIESEHLEELLADRFGREVRDVAIPQLRTPLVGIQRLFEGAFGLGTSEVVFKEDIVIPFDPFPSAAWATSPTAS